MPQNTDEQQKTPADQRPAAHADEDNNAEAESLPFYRNWKVIVPLLLVLGVIGYVSWRYYVDARDFISTDDAYIDGNRVSVSSKILGRIDTLMAAEGDTVQAGETLVVLDPTDLRAQESQMQSSVALAHESIALARVSLEKARTDFERASAQFRDAVVTKEQFEHARSEYDAAKARLTIAQAQESASRAQLATVRTQLLNTVIVAPMSGVVAKRWLLPGDVAQPGQAIFSIYDTKNIWVTANYEETSLGSIALGDSVSIKVDTYPDIAFRGRVIQKGTFTASQFSLIPPNNASGNFTKITQRVPVKISIEPPAQHSSGRSVDLLVGMSVEVKIRVH
ncbi:MAG: HlyD family secretion protein [Acidobacteriota bacterium]